jgi:hypothetical protein
MNARDVFSIIKSDLSDQESNPWPHSSAPGNTHYAKLSSLDVATGGRFRCLSAETGGRRFRFCVGTRGPFLFPLPPLLD